MNLIKTIAPQEARGVVSSDEDTGLQAIYEEGCAAVIWRRTPAPAFQSWMDTLSPEQLPQTRMILRAHQARAAMQELVAACGTPACAERDMLVDDVAALCAIFADVMGAEYVRLRLDVVTTNACRKFHVDRLTARLVCTYRGHGTQYGNAPDQGDPETIFDVPTGSAIMLRGKLWPETPDAALLHRSPPIEGTGESRLLLVLDPVVDPSDAPDWGETTIH